MGRVNSSDLCWSNRFWDNRVRGDTNFDGADLLMEIDLIEASAEMRSLNGIAF